ncbi:MAG: PAS domain S-box protein [Methanothrix sp.]|nr:MAG: PAS domain S-box protein [Methanothrix sp.]
MENIGKPIAILLVEDNPGDVRLIWEMLQDSGIAFEIVSSDRLSEGLEAIAKNEPDVILLDLGLPDSQGIETFHRVNDQASGVPVIVLTTFDDDDLAIGAVQLGAQDYLVKGQIDGNLLGRSIGYAIERNRAQEALRRSEAKYRLLVENSNDIVYQTDNRGNLIFINKMGLKTSEVAEEEMIGQPWAPFLHPEDLADAVKVYRETLETGRSLSNYECRFVTRRGKGRVFPVSLNITVLKDEAGNVLGTQGIARDITECKQAEDQVIAQRDLVLRLSGAASLDEALELCVETALHITGMDCSGVYLFDKGSDELVLAYTTGVSRDFRDTVLPWTTDPEAIRRVMAGKPLYIRYQCGKFPGMRGAEALEGLRALGVIPILYQDQIVGSFHVASHTIDEIPPSSRNALEAIVGMMGSTILRLQAKEELRNAHKQLQDIVEFLPDATFVIDRDKKVIAWNRAIEVMTGVHEEAIIGKGDYAYAVPFYGKERPALVDLIFLDDEVIVSQYNYVRRAGNTIFGEVFVPSLYEGRGAYLWATASPLYDSEGNIAGAIESIRDISERKRAEEALRKRDRLLEGVAMTSHELSLVDFDPAIDQALGTLGHSMDVDRVFIFENIDDPKTGEHMTSQRFTWSRETHSVERDKPAFQNMFYDSIDPLAYEMLSSGTPIKGDVRDFPESVQKVLDPLNIISILLVPIIIKSRLWGHICFGDCRSVRTWSDSEISILFVAAESVGGAVIRNINDENLRKHHKELEERVQERTIELKTKNAEMERFVYTVSHDLRSPLFTIQGFVGFLKKDMEEGDTEQIETDINMIEDGITRMDRLLADTLELSRVGRVVSPPEDVAFGDIVRETLDRISEKLRLCGAEISLAEEWPMVHVDRLRIEEVLINLIENSIKYMGDQEHPQIDLGYRSDGDETAFFVRDNGMGIDPDQLEKVFELFYKIDGGSEGTGVGLTIVNRIIEVHGGRMWIESEKGQGCTIYLTLPLSSARS